MTGRLYGVGLGPGDPELVTVKAARLIGAADVVAYHAARHGRSDRPRASPRRTCATGQIEEAAGLPGHHRDHRPPRRLPGRDRRVLRRGGRPGWPRTSTPGRDVVVLAEGDPFFYGSYMHMHKRLAAPLPDRGRARA